LKAGTEAGSAAPCPIPTVASQLPSGGDGGEDVGA
jgi:hypothetical protein